MNARARMVRAARTPLFSPRQQLTCTRGTPTKHCAPILFLFLFFHSLFEHWFHWRICGTQENIKSGKLKFLNCMKLGKKCGKFKKSRKLLKKRKIKTNYIHLLFIKLKMKQSFKCSL